MNLTSWSSDGRALAGSITLSSGRPAGIVVYDLAAKSYREVSEDAGNWVRWLPDNRRVLYVTVAGEMVVVDTTSGTRTVLNVKLSMLADHSFALSPDGRTFYYGLRRSESDIWLVERK